MRFGLSSLLLLSAFLLPLAAHADSFKFTISGGGDNFTFYIDPANTPVDTTSIPNVNIYSVSPDVADDTDFGGHIDIPGTVRLGTVPGNQFLGFSEIGFSTPDIFDGTTFLPNTPGSPYEADFFGDPTQPYALTIAAGSPVPEPSSLMLLGTGTLGVLGFARRRFVR